MSITSIWFIVTITIVVFSVKFLKNHMKNLSDQISVFEDIVRLLERELEENKRDISYQEKKIFALANIIKNKGEGK